MVHERLDDYIVGAVNETWKDIIDDHLAGCDLCARRKMDLENLTYLLQECLSKPGDKEVEERILKRFRRQSRWAWECWEKIRQLEEENSRLRQEIR
jgi:anti-sigma factor RsiW